MVMTSRTDWKLVWRDVKYILSRDLDGSTLSMPITLGFMSCPSGLVARKFTRASRPGWLLPGLSFTMASSHSCKVAGSPPWNSFLGKNYDLSPKLAFLLYSTACMRVVAGGSPCSSSLA